MFKNFTQSISRKKAIIYLIIAIVIILLVAGGFFLYQDIERKFPDKEMLWNNEYVKDSEFDIVETEEGKTVENKDEGLVVKYPSSWTTVKEGEDIFIVSPETEFSEKGFVLFNSFKEKGACGIGIEIIKCNKVDGELTTFADDLREEIDRIKQYEEYRKMMEDYSPKTEITLLSGKEGIKRTYIKDNSIRMIEIEVPVGQTIYSFGSALIMNEKCVDEFNKIIDEIVINK